MPCSRLMRFFSEKVFERGSLRWRRFVTGLVVAILAGVLLGLAFPLTNFFPLAWIALVPLLVMQRGISSGRIWFYAFIAGLSFWLVHASWLKVFHPLSLLTATPALALYFSLPFALLGVWRRWIRNSRPLLEAILFATLWAGIEYFRSTGFLGFSWGVLGYSQYRFLPVIQIADLGGVWLISWVIAFSNAILAGVLCDGVSPSRRRLWLLGGLLLFVLGYGTLRLAEKPAGPVKRVALLQAFVDPSRDWKADRKAATMKWIEELTQRAARSLPRPDLIIWSETLSSPSALWYYRQARFTAPHSEVRALAEWFVGMPARVGIPILLTAPHKEIVSFTNRQGLLARQMQSYNAAFLVDPKTNVIDSYYKINLVPFGEWFPYKEQFPWVARILAETIASDFTPGTRYTVFNLPQGKFGVMICFEDIFGELCRQLVKAGAEYLVNTTNDYWSKSVQSQEQHAAMAVLRAVENRKYLVRAANTGVTCVIDAWGRMTERLADERPGVLQTEVSLMRDRTPALYTIHGDWLGIAGAWGCALSFLTGLGRRLALLGSWLTKRLGRFMRAA